MRQSSRLHIVYHAFYRKRMKTLHSVLVPVTEGGFDFCIVSFIIHLDSLFPFSPICLCTVNTPAALQAMWSYEMYVCVNMGSYTCYTGRTRTHILWGHFVWSVWGWRLDCQVKIWVRNLKMLVRKRGWEMLQRIIIHRQLFWFPCIMFLVWLQKDLTDLIRAVIYEKWPLHQALIKLNPQEGHKVLPKPGENRPMAERKMQLQGGISDYFTSRVSITGWMRL